MSSSSSSSSNALHNKSGLEYINIYYQSNETLEEWCSRVINGGRIFTYGLCGHDSLCYRMTNKKGTLTDGPQFLCYGYQLVAWKKYRFKRILASKTNKLCLTISHLCGTRNCLNPDHIILEPKYINDQRTHCHFCIDALLRFNDHDYEVVQQFISLGGCPHDPPCGSIMKDQFARFK